MFRRPSDLKRSSLPISGPSTPVKENQESIRSPSPETIARMGHTGPAMSPSSQQGSFEHRNSLGRSGSLGSVDGSGSPRRSRSPKPETDGRLDRGFRFPVAGSSKGGKHAPHIDTQMSDGDANTLSAPIMQTPIVHIQAPSTDGPISAPVGYTPVEEEIKEVGSAEEKEADAPPSYEAAAGDKADDEVDDKADGNVDDRAEEVAKSDQAHEFAQADIEAEEVATPADEAELVVVRAADAPTPTASEAADAAAPAVEEAAPTSETKPAEDALADKLAVVELTEPGSESVAEPTVIVPVNETAKPAADDVKPETEETKPVAVETKPAAEANEEAPSTSDAAAVDKEAPAVVEVKEAPVPVPAAQITPLVPATVAAATAADEGNGDVASEAEDSQATSIAGDTPVDSAAEEGVKLSKSAKKKAKKKAKKAAEAQTTIPATPGEEI